MATRQKKEKRSVEAEAGIFDAATAETGEAYQAIVESAPDAFIVTDREGAIVLANRQTEKLFGYTREELAGQPVEMLVPERFRRAHQRHRDGYASSPYERSMGTGVELFGLRKDGVEFPVDISLSQVTVAGKPHFASAIRDVTDLRNAARERARMAAFPERNPLPVFECDRKGRITYTNPAAEILLSDTEPGVAKSLDQRIFPGFVESVQRCLEEEVDIRDKETQHSGRTYLWSLHPIPDLGRVHVYAVDISSRKRAEEELRAQSLLDDLTGLYNRRGFLSIGGQQWKLAQRNRRLVSLLYIDIDDLKHINDTLGHLEGDRAIIETAEVLRETFRRSDVLGRLGGDEFAALPVYAMEEGVDDLLQRLQKELDTRNAEPGRRFQLSVSVGIAQSDPARKITLPELIARADANMYKNKRDRKNGGDDILGTRSAQGS